MSPNQIARRSRSAGSPALPTAMTTRPQFASSPATAVLTSGELAIDSAIRLAERDDVAPVTAISISLRAPSPSRTTCRARSLSRRFSARLNATSAGSASEETRGAPRPAAAPVAKISSVSLVEVSLSTVTALKVVSAPRFRSFWRTGASIGASVATKDSIVAMSGAIMPAPLAMPLIVTSTPPSFTVAVAYFG